MVRVERVVYNGRKIQRSYAQLPVRLSCAGSILCSQ